MPRSKDWSRVEKLIEEQKFEEARTLCGTIRTAAQAGGNNAEWAEALIKEVQLQIGLSGYETAVRFLRAESWPQDALSQVSLELYYAQSLMAYLDAYSWEIGRRERVDSKGTVDLKAWTRDQIFGEAQRAYARVFARRLELSAAPVGSLGDNLRPGGYPAHVRGTLRDAVTYLSVELLTNSSRWRPEESNELFRLDFARLLNGHPGGRDLKLDDTNEHPLVRAIAALDDLETFHIEQGDGHREAALEARLERLRRLHQAFTDDHERAQIVASLQALLPAYRSLPWWSMGMALLSELVREGSKDLRRAHEVASEGQRAYPDSVGGGICAGQLRALEAADFHLEGMASDGLAQRSLRVRHKNLPKLHFRAYAANLIERIESSRDYNLLHSANEQLAIVQNQKPVASWSVDLPATPDYQFHHTYSTPPLGRSGLYVIVASAKADFPARDNRVMGINFIATDLVVVSRVIDKTLEATVVSGRTGKPLPGVAVHLYEQNYGSKHRKLMTETTNASGVARLSGGDGRAAFVVAQRGDEVALDPQNNYFSRRERDATQTASLVYTDRSIYRPDQKLYFKVVAYSGKGEEARFTVEKGAKLTVSLHDANGQEVAKTGVTTNAFGSAAGEFTIPSGKLLGAWRVQVRDTYSGSAAIRVEEYKRPTFEVSWKDPTEPLRLGKVATLVGEARYFFGLPVTAGQVRYRVTREPVYPWWWRCFGFFIDARGSQTVGSGVAALGGDGTFKVTFTPDADPRQQATKAGKDVSYRYVVKADLTDEGGETRSATRSFRLGWQSIEATLSSDLGFVRERASGVTLTVQRASLDGVGRAGEGSYRLLALKPRGALAMPADDPTAAEDGGGAEGESAGGRVQTAGDKLQPRWKPSYAVETSLARMADGAEQQRGKLTHNAQGEATIKLPPLPAGQYRVRYETTDEFGSKVEAWRDFVVSTGAAAHGGPALPFFAGLEQGQVSVGQTARLYVASGFGDQTLQVELFRSGQLVERRTVTGAGLIELPIAQGDRGGLGLSVWMVRDHQYLSWQGSVSVPWDDKQLKIDFATFRDKLRPGQRETWRVTVRGPDGAAVGRGVAEVLAYMYDRSLDVFAPHSPPSPLSLFPYRGHVPWSRATLSMAPTQWVINELTIPSAPSSHLAAAELQFYDNYAIGGPGGGAPGFGMASGRHMLMMAPGAPPPMQAAPAPARAARGPAAREESDARPDEPKKAENKPAEPGKGAGPGGDEGPAPQIRSNFAETAFFLPQLLTDDQGGATLEFQVPDSVTAWNVWVHTVSRDLRSASLRRDARSVKDLMVRPYLPRFFREADSADLKVMVNNAGDRTLDGSLKLEIFDPETKEAQHTLFQLQTTEQRFRVEAGRSATVTFPLSAPRRVGVYAFQVVARAGDHSDGELRPLPVLPSRMHLTESRFVTLRDRDSRTMTFPDLAKNDDATRIHDQLVVTVDAQLFYTALKALPYLVQYPYECVEQTANRFVSTGIVSSLFQQYPAVARMAAEFSKRTTQLERFDGADPNRKMALEESPWLAQSQGGNRSEDVPLINVLDPRVARAQRDSALSKLRKMQTSIGGFPWFPGGPPSPYMTLYLMHSLAKASEFQVDVPKEVVTRSWNYLASHFRDEYVGCLDKENCGWEFLAFLNYVASSYPDASWTGDALTMDERKRILDYTFRHWKQMAPLSKGQLALTLRRMGRAADAKLVWDSVMDSAKTTADEGTFWAPEDRSWLWYRDTIESHAFALRVLMEMDPGNRKKDGLVQWLLLNKKMGQWKSTRATAEVIYSLIHYLKRQGALGVREEATVQVGQDATLRQQFVFEPDTYVGKAQLVVPGARIAQSPAALSTIQVSKATQGFMFASATWHYSTDRLPTEGRGDFFSVNRSYFKRENNGKEFVLRPLTDGQVLHPGDEVEVQLSLRSKHEAEYVHLRDPRAAGLEPEAAVSRYKWDLGLVYYEEVRDSGMNFFFERLPVGEYTFKYRLRANLGGTFRVGPATVQSMYAPEFNAFSAGHIVSIK